jgi:hypothetical protein
MPSWLPWCNQFTGNPEDVTFKRANMTITQADVDKALAWYEKELGALPKQVATFNKTLVFPEDVEVIEHGGCLKWELYLGMEPQKENPVVVIEKDAFKEITGEDGWGVATLKEIPPPQPLTEPPDKSLNQQGSVSKVELGETVVPVFQKSPVKVKKIKKPVRHGIMGRPDKIGLVSRTTLWRRAKKLKKMERRLL